MKLFAGRPSAAVRPWLEAHLERDDEAFLGELVSLLAGLLGPGSHLMVGYGDDETERGLKRRFPPAATPVGKALADAGCTWFKDWYYPEGWLEGGFKLQGNLAPTGQARAEQEGELRRELEAWLAQAPDDELGRRARARAASLLR